MAQGVPVISGDAFPAHNLPLLGKDSKFKVVAIAWLVIHDFTATTATPAMANWTKVDP